MAGYNHGAAAIRIPLLMFVGGLGQGDVGALGGSRIRVVGSAGRSRSPLDQAVGGASGRSDLRLGRRTAQLTRRELRPPVPVESATWQAGGEFDCGVSERGEWWGRVRAAPTARS